MKLNQNQKNIIMALAESFYDSCRYDEDYPFSSPSGQYGEFKELLESNQMNWGQFETMAKMAGIPLEKVKGGE